MRSIELEIAERLNEAGRTVSTAESCTGGLLAERITRQPGASSYYMGGIIAYDNRVKTEHLDIPMEVIVEHGAVSAQVAERMASGVRVRFKTDYGIGITGVAGPSGGSRDKPVGLVYVAVADAGGCIVRGSQFSGDRMSIREQSAVQALRMLRERMS